MSSIITYDETAAKALEIGAPSPEARLRTLGLLARKGVETCIRLRPYIIGVSNINIETLIRRASEEGVKHISTEFFCLEMRSMHKLKARYDMISKYAGFDIVKFYRAASVGSGYLRLNYKLKGEYIQQLQELCKKYGLNFNCSDAHHKEKSCSGSCCGLPSESKTFGNYQRCQFTEALMIAKKNGTVRWSDISKHGDAISKFKFTDSIGLNTGDSTARAKFRNVSLLDMMRNAWNRPNSGISPYKYFGGVLVPIGTDESGDVIYKFNPK